MSTIFVLRFGAIIGILAGIGCSQLPPTASSVSASASSDFSVQALTEGYLVRKVRHWLGQNNETALVREIEFARVKHPDLMEDIMLADPALYAQVAAVPAVEQQRSNALFDAFMLRLSGFRPILSYDIDVVDTGALSLPYDVAIDSIGNLYIADTSNNRIRKLTPAGVVSNLATGISAVGLAVDSQDNVWAAENTRIRKITPQGGVSTIAGTLSSDFGGDGGSALTATFRDIRDVAVDSLGNVYIADSGSQRIRKVGTNGIVTTIAGNGSGSFSGDGALAVNATLDRPSRLAIDAQDNLFFTDHSNYRIRKITPAGIISTVAGSGNTSNSGANGSLATQAGLGGPYGLAIDTGGNLFVSTLNTSSHYIRQISPDGKIQTIAGQGTSGNLGDGGPALSARINTVYGVAAHPVTQEIYLSSLSSPYVVRKLVPQYE
jgi:sugar lactone lactonase YvrE